MMAPLKNKHNDGVNVERPIPRSNEKGFSFMYAGEADIIFLFTYLAQGAADTVYGCGLSRGRAGSLSILRTSFSALTQKAT